MIQTNCKEITLSNGIATTANIKTSTFYNVPVNTYIKACLFDPIFLRRCLEIWNIYRINISSQKVA
jgi:hypothetical protein